MYSVPQVYMWARDRVLKMRELASCILAAWLQSIPGTSSCQLSSSQVLTKEETLIIRKIGPKWLEQKVGWSTPKALLGLYWLPRAPCSLGKAFTLSSS